LEKCGVDSFFDVISWNLLRSSLHNNFHKRFAYPDGAQMKDDQEMLPMHLACRNGASKGVVLTLLYVFPESLEVKDRKGRSPYNLVEASSSQNREAVLLALKRYTEENGGIGADDARKVDPQQKVNEVDYDNRTILFRLILKKDWNGACQRCESFPEEAATWIVTKGFHGNLRFLPLHKACVLSPPMGIIEALISAYSEGSKSKDQDGWLPIHCACFYGASQTITNALLEANPSGAHNKDDEGRMPLHYAALKAAPETVISSLLRANPKAAVSKDDEGRLPIHHACSKGAPEGSIQALLKVSSKGAQSKDDQGRLPLHHACRKNASEIVIKTLLTIYPRAAQVKDDQEKLPIHYACQNGADALIVNMLMKTHPESIKIKNG
jgi:ankyrin repeat protein